MTTSNPNANTGSTKIQLNGPEADIEVNGLSLMTLLQERLNMLVPNPKLEAEWDELKALGDQYRKLETELKAKSKMWQALKDTP
jgi:hypothetical protein